MITYPRERRLGASLPSSRIDAPRRSSLSHAVVRAPPCTCRTIARAARRRRREHRSWSGLRLEPSCSVGTQRAERWISPRLDGKLPLDDDLRGRFDDRLRQACGQVPPEAALELEAPGLLADADADAGALRLPVSLTNVSADEVILLEVRAPDALRVDLRRSGGAPFTFPLSLSGADFSSPSPPEEVVGEVTRLEAVLRLISCQDAPGAQRDGPRPLLELMVRSASGGAATTIPYGDEERAVSRLRAGCSERQRTPDLDE